MRTRTISAIGIVAVSLIPALLGGAWFAATIAIVMGLGLHELFQLLDIKRPFIHIVGFGTIAGAAAMAWVAPDGAYLPIVIAASLMVLLAEIVVSRTLESDNRLWASSFGAIWYLALPTFAAVALRGNVGDVRAESFQSFAESLPGTGRTAAGLGWFLLALLITWAADTAAYLVGKSVGRTKLIPRVSPNKTVEGAIGGLAGAGAIAVICVVAFGLPVHPLTAIVLGVLLGVIGMIGDLCESMIKRRAEVKDSGTLIPGHGGILDRIDSLLFVLISTWALLPLLTR